MTEQLERAAESIMPPPPIVDEERPSLPLSQLLLPVVGLVCVDNRPLSAELTTNVSLPSYPPARSIYYHPPPRKNVSVGQL